MDISPERIAAVDAECRANELAGFSNRDAWWVADRIQALARERGFAIGLEIVRGSVSLVRGLMDGAGADNFAFIQRKMALTTRFERPSFAVALMFWKDPALVERWALDLNQYALSGGAVPIRLAGSGMVGVVTVSGAPPEVDHRLAMDALIEFRARQGSSHETKQKELP